LYLQRIASDVLVIGAGGAGLMAAYEACKHNVKVVLVSKGKVQRSGCTIMAPGAIAGVDDSWSMPDDSQRLHMIDTIRGGAYINEQNLVKIVVEESPKSILEMESIGALWQRKEDGIHYDLRAGGGHQFPRSVYLEDRTGRELVRTLVSVLRAYDVPLIENVMILRLIQDEEGISGAVGLNLENLEFILFESKTIILASGGGGNVYKNTDNPIDVTGDGYILAYQSGLSLFDMEFIQFFPIGFLDPPSLQGELAGLIYYSHLLNSRKERFMKKYDAERLENSTRDLVTRAIFQEIREGRGTSKGGVYCDLTFHKPGYIKKATPSLYQTYRQFNIDPEKDLFEIAPTCHFFMGGVLIDDDWQTDIYGLFAAGEVCAGVHGANRLSQNALAEILVSGKRSGKKAAELAKTKKIKRIHPKEILIDKSRIESILKIKSNNNNFRISISNIQQQLKNIMWNQCGIIRNQKLLQDALRKIGALENKLIDVPICNYHYFNWQLIKYLETENLIRVSRIIILSALQRKESRGAHFREDYVNRDDKNWLKHIVIKRGRDKPVISYKKVNNSLRIIEGK